MATPSSDIPSPSSAPSPPASGSPSPTRSPNLKASLPNSASPPSPTLPMPLIVQHSADVKPDLRHMTSLGGIAEARRDSTHPGSRRVSAHLQTGARMGSKSPSSIPSSPTSVHSSSSAIFERDIEPLVSISPLIHPNPVQTHHHQHSPTHRPQSLSPSSSHQHQPSTVSMINPHSNPTSTSSVGSIQHQQHLHQINPHRIPRAQTTAAIEQSVPSVLDSAAEILAGLQDTSGPEGDRIEVEAPVPISSAASFGSGSGQRSPYASGPTGFAALSSGSGGRMSSRSPSPGGANRVSGSLLFNGSGVSPTTSPIATARPAPKISTSTLNPSSSSSSPNTALPPSQPPNTAISPPSGVTAFSFSSVPPLERINSVGDQSQGEPSPSVVTATPTSAYFSLAPTSRETSRAGTPGPATTNEVHLNDDVEPMTTAKGTTAAATTSTTSQPTSQTPSPKLSPSTSPQSHPQVRLRDPATLPSNQHASHQPTSPSHHHPQHQQKRLSFLSYADLLSSTPVSTLPLSSFTSGNYKGEEPPHLAMNNTVGDVLAFASASTSANASSAGGSPPYEASPLSSPSPVLLGSSGTGVSSGAGASLGLGLGSASVSSNPVSSPTKSATGSRTPSLRSGAVGRDRDSLIMLEDLVGGEWEREGLGRGLEERLEDVRLMGVGKA